ncbi:cupin domain-containing protein [Vibrio navarrensis]|uniref:cupin domain-containing protein n=1 Tax=Vibrio navarrensis TaxID=29495 RepID=UPI0029C097B4|nr:cupin domain-containing protein [Vibrio navarrensis]MBE4619115.1 cupin [Vibrio navarrensis]
MRKIVLLPLIFLSYQNWAATSRDLDKTDLMWDGTRLPSQALDNPEVTIKEIVIEPGEQLPLHHHPVINAGLLLEGQLTVVNKDTHKTLQLNQGDTIVELINKTHYGKNNGDIPAKIVVFYLAEKGQPVTVTDSQQ